jgi:hypothetical protein
VSNLEIRPCAADIVKRSERSSCECDARQVDALVVVRVPASKNELGADRARRDDAGAGEGLAEIVGEAHFDHGVRFTRFSVFSPCLDDNRRQSTTDAPS